MLMKSIILNYNIDLLERDVTNPNRSILTLEAGRVLHVWERVVLMIIQHGIKITLEKKKKF